MKFKQIMPIFFCSTLMIACQIEGLGDIKNILNPQKTSNLPEAPAGLLTAESPIKNVSSTLKRLNITIELHVENSDLSIPEETRYVLDLAEIAHDNNIKLSVGMGKRFLSAYADDASVTVPNQSLRALTSSSGNSDFTLSSLISTLQDDYEHVVTFHADLSEDSVSELAIKEELEGYVDILTEAGADGANIASGMCNPGNWIEGAKTIGIESIAGVVEYCELSLNSVLQTASGVDSGCTPTSCHDASPEDDRDQRASGWYANASSTWISSSNTPTTSAESEDSVFIVGSFGDSHPACLAEYANDGHSRNCDDGVGASDSDISDDYSSEVQGISDADEFLEDVENVVSNHLSGGNGDAYHTALSTNKVVTTQWMEGFFSSLFSGVKSNSTLSSAVTFSTLLNVSNINRGELGL